MSLSIPTIATLKTEIADELGEDTSDSEVMTRIERWLNETFEDVLSRLSDWKWARDYKHLILTPAYSTGTVSVTQNSAVVTGSGTTFNTSWKNRVFWIPSTGANYKVLSVDSTTQLTLEIAYQEANASGASYYLVQNRYPLDNQAYESGIIQIINPYATDPLSEIDMEVFLRRNPRLRDLGDPTEYAVWGQEDPMNTDSNAPMIYFDRFPTVQRTFVYYFHKQFDRITGISKFPLPSRNHRQILVAGCKLRSGRFDGEQQSEIRSEYEGYINLMIQDNSKSGDRTRMFRETDIPSSLGDTARYPSNYPDIDL